jgi:hypothetical protein
MHLRHIRPRSVDWYDALIEDQGRGLDRLSPEEKLKLRTLVAMESATGAAHPELQSQQASGP